MSIREVIQLLEQIFKALIEMLGISFGEEDAEGTDEPTETV